MTGAVTGADLARAASGLIGVRFLLHGRDPATGLDCIGLLAAALAAIGRPAVLPSGYALRMRDLAGWLPPPRTLGFTCAERPVEPGDAVLVRLGAAQLHLAIAASDGGWIHAHAGLRRVVHQPALPDGAILHHWRLTPCD
ncbi:hypothetical protein [Novosphingobium sp.]|uniref:hypothetical protein n=1 Tax=Novosphingobium sp. TaxID=1874826 RepID=UPI002732EB1D|nr:hypothetical protein [Novosphingobium sp.]MDP3906348.1 hypothetical protein [Novosphingobium sp.]